MKTYLHSPILTATLFCLLFTPLLSAQAPTVSCPAATVVFNDQSTNDFSLWDGAWYWDPIIHSHNLSETVTDLTITATDHCSAAGDLHFRYILSLDLDQDQVVETFIDSDSLPGSNTIYIGNKPNDLFSGIPREFDARPVPISQRWGFGITTIADSSSRTAHIIWKNDMGQTTTPQIPYGSHHIQWLVTDSCGATTSCGYDFVIKDGDAPTITCINGYTMNLSNTMGGEAVLWFGPLMDVYLDNYTPNLSLKIGIRKAGTGTGIPYNPDSTIQKNVLYTCADFGPQNVELWAEDLNGNTNYCTTTITVTDNLGICTITSPTISGTITTPNQPGIENLFITFTGSPIGAPPVTVPVTLDTGGTYIIPPGLPISSIAAIKPSQNLDPLNGVNTWDLLMIGRHIIGVEPFTALHQMIAADANRSGTITTYDIVQLRKLILGTYTELPDNTSWRFIDKNYLVPNPASPFLEMYRDSTPLSVPGPYDFIGCKIGDVDLMAPPHFKDDQLEDRSKGTAYISLINKQVTAGETFKVRFNSPIDIQALQMTVAAKGLHLDNIIPVEWVLPENFASFPGNVFTTSFTEKNTAFDVQFTALTNGELKDMLTINSDITLAVCFDENGVPLSIGLRFVEDILPGDLPVLYAPTPNPWRESTQIGFYLPKDSDVQFSVVDPNGAVIKTVSGSFKAGEQQVRFSKNDFPRAGMYYVRMSAGDFVEVKKMVLVK